MADVLAVEARKGASTSPRVVWGSPLAVPARSLLVDHAAFAQDFWQGVLDMNMDASSAGDEGADEFSHLPSLLPVPAMDLCGGVGSGGGGVLCTTGRSHDMLC